MSEKPKMRFSELVERRLASDEETRALWVPYFLPEFIL